MIQWWNDMVPTSKTVNRIPYTPYTVYTICWLIRSWSNMTWSYSYALLRASTDCWGWCVICVGIVRIVHYHICCTATGKKKTNLTRKPLANPDCCRETLPFAWPLRGTKAGTKHELSKTFKGKSNLMCGWRWWCCNAPNSTCLPDWWYLKLPSTLPEAYIMINDQSWSQNSNCWSYAGHTLVQSY